MIINSIVAITLVMIATSILFINILVIWISISIFDFKRSNRTTLIQMLSGNGADRMSILDACHILTDLFEFAITYL